METLLDGYKDHHKGKKCAILGGGTSLPFDIKALPDDIDIFIGVNQHSLILPLDYISFVDKKMWPYLKDHCDKFITRTVDLLDQDDKLIIRMKQSLWHNYSGALAIYAADKMGMTSYVCGIDQYNKSDDDRYYWWEGPQTPQRQKDRKNHSVLLPMKNFIRTLRYPNKVYFMSGRIKEQHQ